jgi:sortase A
VLWSTANSSRVNATPWRRWSKPVRWLERLLLLVGLVLLAVFLTAHLHRAVMFYAETKSFERAKHEATSRVTEREAAANVASEETKVEPASDNTRSRSGRDQPGNAASTSRGRSDVPLAILRIPKINLAVPVLNGTDEITLNRGVGRIAGTAAPGEMGNIGIAGHRDSFFRQLKEINRGDLIELETTSSSEIYVVDRILVTDPDDISELQPRGAQSVTLVTCYPFHFVGPAPRRFIVQAFRKR